MTGTDVVVAGACHHDCPDTCVWDVTVRDGVAVRLRGNRDHPTTRGELCPKVNRFLDRVYHPDRILTPLERIGPKGSGDYQPLAWDVAIERIAGRVRSIIEGAGGPAILPYSFDGTEGLIQKGVMADRFFDALGASDVDRHLCGVTAWMGAADVYERPYGIDPEDLRHARTILLWGTNTLLTNRHLWPVIDEARSAGATVTVIDPIRTPTAAAADRHLQIRPGTDVALVLGMIHVISRDGLVDGEWLEDHTSGWEELEWSARPMSPARVEAITNVTAEHIVEVAREFATVRPAAVRSLIGPEHRRQGRQIMRAIAMLPAVTGAWRDVGGGLARSTQIYFEDALGLPGPRPGRRRFNMADLGRVLTAADLDPPIQALFVHNSNPAVICPDQNRVLQGLARDDLFTVVVEQFMTDTARYADIVLPATTQIEHLDVHQSWGHLYVALNQPAIQPRGEALPNTEIFRRLASALELDGLGLDDDDETLVRWVLASSDPWMAGITYERLQRDTWARLGVPARFQPFVESAGTLSDGRMRLGALEYRPGDETPDGDPVLSDRFPLALLSRKQHPKFLNANYGGFDAHLPPERAPKLQIHPVDADRRGIADGDQVVVWNDRGTLTVAATVGDEVQPGLVSLPFGWWHRYTPEGRGVNALTNPVAPDGVGSAAFHDTLVEVRRLDR